MFLTLISISKSPEKTIEGEWNELIWEYEKVLKNDTVNADYKEVKNYVKEKLEKN